MPKPEAPGMRVVFIGASSFGLNCLKAVYPLPGISVVGLITNPKTFSISYSDSPVTNVLHADFVAWASKHSLPCFEMARTMRDQALHAWVRTLAPQMFVVVGWYHMVPKSLREIAPAYGLHASLLPDYSGGAPLVWAIINGESQTGITVFQMDDGVDSGPIAGQKSEPIFPTDTIATLYARIEERGIELLREVLPQISRGSLVLRPQDETRRRIMRQRCPADGLIDWRLDALTIERFIRAQTRPYPGAFTSFGGQQVHIWGASVAHPDGDGQNEIGCISRSAEGAYRVGTGRGAIILTEVSIGEKPLSQSQLAGLFGEGGQVLGRAASG